MIGICIKYYHENYGGMLQAYATTKMLEMIGCDYEIIRYEKKKNILFALKSLPRVLNRVLLNDKKETIQKKISLKLHKEFSKNNRIRMNAFNEFRVQKFNKLSEVYFGYDSLKKNATKYSTVITGSDQLWSPAGLPTNFYNLMFVPDKINKVSYASSFGVSNIPWYQRTRTREFLDRIESISVRENAGKKIIKELTGRDVPVVLDPVLMISKKTWDKLIPYKKIYDKDYIFAYFLGKNKEGRDFVNKIAKEKGLKIVTLRHNDQYVKDDENFGDYAPYNVGPEGFLNILRGAKYICTDSFHGTVFSIINEKKFIIFNRYSLKSKVSKNSRIDSLCENLGINDRRYNDNSIKTIDCEIDYKVINKKIEILRKESYNYLKESLKKEK